MAKVCTDICVTLGATQIEMADTSGIYPNNALGWQYVATDPAVPTTDINTATLTITRDSSSWTFNIDTTNYSNPASPSMEVLDVTVSAVDGLELVDGLYIATYALTFVTADNCADDAVQVILLTRNLEACLYKFWTSIVKKCTPDASMKEQYDKLCMELYALKLQVNCGTLTTDAEAQEIITDLAARCAALSKECSC